MSTGTESVLKIILIGVLVYFIYGWWQDRIEFNREHFSSGWYKYSNDKLEFVYPNKLRNCTECSLNTGSVYKVMTDGEYIIMVKRNKNSSYLVESVYQFAEPRNNKMREVREKLDSIVASKGVVPSDSVMIENLHIREISLDRKSNKLNYEMELFGELLSVEVAVDELNCCGSESWIYWKLKRDGEDINKYSYGLVSGRAFVSDGEDEFFLEFQKIKRTTLYTHNTGDLDEDQLAMIFNSIKIKE